MKKENKELPNPEKKDDVSIGMFLGMAIGSAFKKKNGEDKK